MAVEYPTVDQVLEKIVLAENVAEVQYTRKLSAAGYLRFLLNKFPRFCNRIEAERFSYLLKNVSQLDKQGWEFDWTERGGRGEAYAHSQKNCFPRMDGIRMLLGMIHSEHSTCAIDELPYVLDVLGGDGTVARAADRLKLGVNIITADISDFMVSKCLEMGMLAIRQSATYSVFKNETLDGVLLAYGTHHLTTSERRDALKEAFRTCKVGAVTVLHDFENGGAVAEWFQKVVHTYSRTGHPHAHFTRAELKELFSAAGFSDCEIVEIHDPISAVGRSESDAIDKLISHIYSMYDLVKIGPNWRDRIEKFLELIFGKIIVEKKDEDFRAYISRAAIAARAVKLTRCTV